MPRSFLLWMLPLAQCLSLSGFFHSRPFSRYAFPVKRPSLGLPTFAALALTSFLAFPAFPFDYPLTDTSIRDAYFLGRREGGIPSDIRKPYSRSIDKLHQGNCVSKARIETPFLQMAEYAGSMPPIADDRSPFAERFSDTSFLLPNGESAELQFDPKSLDSSDLKILIDTPDGQHAETSFDLQSLR